MAATLKSRATAFAAWRPGWRAVRHDGSGSEIDTDAGVKRLALLERNGSRYTFRAFMGAPTEIDRVTLEVAGERA